MAVEVGRRGGEEGEGGGGGGAGGEGAGGGAEGVPARGGTGHRRERERDTHQSPKFRRQLRTDRLTLFH